MKEIKNYIQSYQKIACTNFDENRINSVNASIERLSSKKRLENIPLNKIIWNQHCLQIKYDCEIITKFATEPLSIFPDMNLWLFDGDQAVGLCSLKAQDIIWSTEQDERGYLCGKILYTDIKVKLKIYKFRMIFFIVGLSR